MNSKIGLLLLYPFPREDKKNIIPCLLKYVFESCGGDFRFFHLNLIILCFGWGHYNWWINFIYIYIYIYICVCVCVCVLFLCGFKFKKGKDRVINQRLGTQLHVSLTSYHTQYPWVQLCTEPHILGLNYALSPNTCWSNDLPDPTSLDVKLI